MIVLATRSRRNDIRGIDVSPTLGGVFCAIWRSWGGNWSSGKDYRSASSVRTVGYYSVSLTSGREQSNHRLGVRLRCRLFVTQAST